MLFLCYFTMNEIKTHINQIQGCQTIGDLLKMSGAINDMNQDKEFIIIVDGNPKRSMSDAAMFAEDLIDELNSDEASKAPLFN